jgi:hypothetical protein
MTGIRQTDNERSDREGAMYTVCSQFAIGSFGDLSVTTSNMTTRNIRAMMQGVEGDTMLKRKAYLGLLAVAIAVVSVAPAFAQQTGKTRVVSDEVRERCRA